MVMEMSAKDPEIKNLIQEKILNTKDDLEEQNKELGRSLNELFLEFDD